MHVCLHLAHVDAIDLRMCVPARAQAQLKHSDFSTYTIKYDTNNTAPLGFLLKWSEPGISLVHT